MGSNGSKCPECKCPECKCPECNCSEYKCPEYKCPESNVLTDKTESNVLTDRTLVISSYNLNTGLNAGGGVKENSNLTVHKLCKTNPQNHTSCMWKYDGKMLNTLYDKKYNLNVKDNAAIFKSDCTNANNISNCTWNITKIADKENVFRIVNNNGLGLGIPANKLQNLKDDELVELSQECNNQSTNERCYWKIEAL